MPTERAAALGPVTDDLRKLFADRLQALVAYGWRRDAPVSSLALVRSLTIDDLTACAARAAAWRHGGAAVPLILTRDDFTRSLDAFPIEYGEIIHQHEVLFGRDPFAGLTVADDDVRRACEVQAKSHLLHLREDFIESGGRRQDVETLVHESAAGFAALLRQLARLDREPADRDADLERYASTRLGLETRTTADLLAIAGDGDRSTVDAIKLFPDYLAAMERLAVFVDAWRAR